MEGDIITLQDIFVYDHSAGFDEDGKAQGYLRSTGLRPKFLDKMEHSNVHVDPMLFAMEGTAVTVTTLTLRARSVVRDLDAGCCTPGSARWGSASWSCSCWRCRVERRLTTEERVAQYAARAERLQPGAGAPCARPLRAPRTHALESAKTAAAAMLKRNQGLEAEDRAAPGGRRQRWRPAEWLLFHAAVFLRLSILGLLLGGGNLVLGLIFMAIGAIGPWFYLGFRRKRRKKKFERRASRHAAADVRLAGGRSLAGPVGRHHRPRGHRARSPASSARSWSRPASVCRSRPRSRAWPTGSRARTSSGS